MGSWSTSASCNPALVYSLRRLEASTMYLPAPCSRGALERVEGHVVFYACERRRRVGIEPRGPRLRPPFCGRVEVAGPSLPLTVRAPCRGLQMLHPYVLLRDVVHG